jgi:hypothetical protein
MSDLLSIGPRVIMSQLRTISRQIEGFFSDGNPELDFLFDSLLISLKTASKNSGSSSIARAIPSIKHAQTLSTLLEVALLKLPVPSLHGHIQDLFEYFQRTLQENLHIPIHGELDDLAQLAIELRKGITSLSEVPNIEPKIQENLQPAEPHPVSN